MAPDVTDDKSASDRFVRKVSAGQVGIGKVGAGQPCLGQVGASQIGLRSDQVPVGDSPVGGEGTGCPGDVA